MADASEQHRAVARRVERHCGMRPRSWARWALGPLRAVPFPVRVRGNDVDVRVAAEQHRTRATEVERHRCTRSQRRTCAERSLRPVRAVVFPEVAEEDDGARRIDRLTAEHHGAHARRVPRHRVVRTHGRSRSDIAFEPRRSVPFPRLVVTPAAVEAAEQDRARSRRVIGHRRARAAREADASLRLAPLDLRHCRRCARQQDRCARQQRRHMGASTGRHGASRSSRTKTAATPEGEVDCLNASVPVR